MTARTAFAERRPAPSSRPPRAARRAAVARAVRDLDELARILEATRKRAEAVAARRIAADLRRPWQGTTAALCPICDHRHASGTRCCTLCGYRTVRP